MMRKHCDFLETEEHDALHTSHICFIVALRHSASERPWTVNHFRQVDCTISSSANRSLNSRYWKVFFAARCKAWLSVLKPRVGDGQISEVKYGANSPLLLVRLDIL